MTNDKFAAAATIKLRYPSSKGLLTVEDLFDLPLTTTRANGVSLDTIAKAAHKLVKEAEEISFVDESTPRSTGDELALDIVKDIIAVKKSQNAQMLDRKVKAEKKKQILALIADKQNDELAGKPLAELLAMVEAL